MTARRHIESDIQSNIMRYLDMALPTTYRAFAIPNGGRRDKITGAILKREGVKAGIADVGLIGQGGWVAFMEIKTNKGRLSPAQIEFRDWCGSNGVPYAVVRGLDEAEETLRGWNVPLRARSAA